MTAPRRRRRKYRSKFEARFAADMRARKLKFRYEHKKFHFTQPAKKRVYNVDFQITGKSWYIECKGRLTLADRQKMLWVRESNPGLDVRFIFQNASVPIRKGSKTTYGDWATKNGFLWAEKTIPEEWL